jgi:hypothetical protein
LTVEPACSSLMDFTPGFNFLDITLLEESVPSEKSNNNPRHPCPSTPSTGLWTPQ